MGKMHWMSEYWLEVNMKDVQFAKKLLRNPIFEQTPMNNAHRIEDNYVIKNVDVTGYSVKDVKVDGGTVDKGAVFFKIDTGLIQLGKSYYPCLRFSVPKSQILHHETDELYVTQDITITEWAHQNCYMLPVNKVLEDWGKMMMAMFSRYNTKAWDFAPMFCFSPYKPIIEKIKKAEMHELVKNYKKKEGRKSIMENGNDNKPKMVQQKRSKEPFREEAQYIFYTDGSGNWASNKKHKDKGHFSVYLKNTEERWKKKHDKLTGNQAELWGVMAGLSIAMQRKYKRVKILTDSMNVVNWVTKKKDSDDYFWNAKHPNIIELVEKLREMMKKIPELEIKHISRDVNFAHAF